MFRVLFIDAFLMGDAVPLSYQHGTVGDALAPGVGPESNRAGFLEQTLQGSPGREVEAAEMLDLEPVGDRLPHQQVADFLRGIRPQESRQSR
jgi:hypothetical protein